jgi:hypothetical protein
VRFLQQFDHGWLYLLSGLALTVAAIVLPAKQDLEALQEKREAIALDLADLEHQIGLYQSFLDELSQDNPLLQQRMIEMQFNKPSDGTPIVFDGSAAKTPLEWIELRSRRVRAYDIEQDRTSMLTALANGRGRLWLAGGGVFVIFIGLVRTPLRQSSP